MKFFQFDPRNSADAKDTNEGIFNFGPVLGIEVTVPALAARCTAGNLDHHGSGDTSETPSACEQALEFETNCPECGDSWFNHGLSGPLCGMARPEWTRAETVVTVRPDADSITAMAVIENRSGYRPVDEELVSSVGRFDRLGPSAGKPTQSVTAIARKACDFKVALADRVQWVSDLLAGADKTAEVTELCSAHEAELEAARKASELTLYADGRIVCVVSTHRFATTLGYESAPVVVAFNPAMLVDSKDPAKGTYRKFTVCRYDSHVPCDLPAALTEFQKMEHGWGGRGDIFGSPQGVSSKLTLERVVEVVSRHLK